MFTIVLNYGSMELWFNMGKLCYYGKTMVLWRNYGTILNIVVLYWKLWYYIENYKTSIYERKE